MTVFIIIFFGLALGSFLSVIFSRLELAELPRPKQRTTRATKAKSHSTAHDIFFGRSRCDHCHKHIAWYDNIPLISHLVLRGRCRHCGKQISVYHPVLELSAAMVVLASDLFYGLHVQFFITAVFGLILLLLFAFDARYGILPNKVVIPGIILALVVIATQFALSLSPNPMLLLPWEVEPGLHLLGGVAAGGFFLLLSLLSRGAWIGGGDIKLGMLIGLLLGLPYVLVALVLAYLIGTAYAVALLVTRHANLQTMVPFGPMLIAGFFVAAYYGDFIIEWYATWFTG